MPCTTGKDSDFCMVTSRGVAEQGRKPEGTSHHGSVPKAMSQAAASNCKDRVKKKGGPFLLLHLYLGEQFCPPQSHS